MAKIVFSESFQKSLSDIEDFIFKTTNNLEQVDRFLDEFDRVLVFILHNPNAAAIHPLTGDQTWVMGDGRYRIFFKAVGSIGTDQNVFLTHIIDNRQLNLEVYPNNTLPTYEED